MRIAVVAPVVVPRSADRLRRDRARRVAARRRPGRRRPRRHAVRVAAARGPRPTLVSPMAEPPDPRELGQRLVRRRTTRSRRTCRSTTSTSCTTTPASSARSAARCCAAIRPWCTRCTDRGPSRTVRSTRCSREHVHLVAISDAQRADNLDVPYAGTVHNGIDLDAYPYREEKERRPRLHRARQPRQGTEGGDHDRPPRRAARCT